MRPQLARCRGPRDLPAYRTGAQGHQRVKSPVSSGLSRSESGRASCARCHPRYLARRLEDYRVRPTRLVNDLIAAALEPRLFRIDATLGDRTAGCLSCGVEAVEEREAPARVGHIACLARRSIHDRSRPGDSEASAAKATRFRRESSCIRSLRPLASWRRSCRPHSWDPRRAHACVRWPIRSRPR